MLAAWLCFLPPACAGGFLPDGAFGKNATGTTAAAFIKDPYGAVYAALGMAGSAYRGAYSVFYNPAGLTGERMSALRQRRTERTELFEKRAEAGITVVESSNTCPTSYSVSAAGNPSLYAVGASYDSMFESYSRSALTFSRPMGAGTGAVSVLYASQDDLDGFSTRGDYTGTFSAYDAAFGLSYARPVRLAKGEFDAGITVKYITSHLETESGGTIAADLGILARDFADQGGLVRDFAVTVRNLGLPMKIGSEADPLPLELSAGAMLDAGYGWYGYADAKFPCDYSPYVAVGIEWKPVERRVAGVDFALRAGFNMKKANELGGLGGWSAGAGLGLAGITLDYAWVPMNDLGTTNRFSFTWQWGGAKYAAETDGVKLRG